MLNFSVSVVNTKVANMPPNNRHPPFEFYPPALRDKRKIEEWPLTMLWNSFHSFHFLPWSKNRQLNPKGPADDLWLESWRKETTDLTVTNRVQLQVQCHQERVPNTTTMFQLFRSDGSLFAVLKYSNISKVIHLKLIFNLSWLSEVEMNKSISFSSCCNCMMRLFIWEYGTGKNE